MCFGRTRFTICTITCPCRGPDGAKLAEEMCFPLRLCVRTEQRCRKQCVLLSNRSFYVAGVKNPVEKGKLNIDGVGHLRLPPPSPWPGEYVVGCAGWKQKWRSSFWGLHARWRLCMYVYIHIYMIICIIHKHTHTHIYKQNVCSSFWGLDARWERRWRRSLTKVREGTLLREVIVPRCSY